jgi:hypothetical protein
MPRLRFLPVRLFRPRPNTSLTAQHVPLQTVPKPSVPDLGRRGVYPLWFPKSVQVVENQWVVGRALSSVRMVLKTGCLREREWGFVLELTPEILRSAHDDNVFLEMRRPGDEFGEIC